MKKVCVCMLVLGMLVLATASYAFGPGGGMGGRGGCDDCIGGPGSGQGGLRNLNLSKDQADKMWQLKEKFRTDTRDSRYQMFQARRDLRDLYADPKTDQNALLAKQKEVNALQQKMQDKMAEMKVAARSILTPEQLKQWNEMSQGRGHGMGRGRCMGGFGPANSSGIVDKKAGRTL